MPQPHNDTHEASAYTYTRTPSRIIFPPYIDSLRRLSLYNVWNGNYHGRKKVAFENMRYCLSARWPTFGRLAVQWGLVGYRFQAVQSCRLSAVASTLWPKQIPEGAKYQPSDSRSNGRRSQVILILMLTSSLLAFRISQLFVVCKRLQTLLISEYR